MMHARKVTLVEVWEGRVLRGMECSTSARAYGKLGVSLMRYKSSSMDLKTSV